MSISDGAFKRTDLKGTRTHEALDNLVGSSRDRRGVFHGRRVAAAAMCPTRAPMAGGDGEHVWCRRRRTPAPAADEGAKDSQADEVPAPNGDEAAAEPTPPAQEPESPPANAEDKQEAKGSSKTAEMLAMATGPSGGGSNPPADGSRRRPLTDRRLRQEHTGVRWTGAGSNSGGPGGPGAGQGPGGPDRPGMPGHGTAGGQQASKEGRGGDGG